MNHIPEYLLSSKRLGECSRSLRFLALEGVPEDVMAHDLAAAYARFEGEEERRKIAAMILQLAESCGCSKVDGLAKRIGIPSLGHHTYAETIAHSIFGYRGCTTLRFSDEVEEYDISGERVDFREPRLVAADPDMRRMIPISRRDSIVAYRTAEGQLTLAAFCDAVGDVLIDEESFCDEWPLYFSEKCHFRSPVACVLTARKVLECVLSIIGYPPMRIRPAVFFTAHDCVLINDQDYMGWDAPRCDEWPDVEVTMRGDIAGRLFVGRTLDLDPFRTLGDMDKIDRQLYLALKATAMVYKTLGERESCRQVDRQHYEKRISRLGIFI